MIDRLQEKIRKMKNPAVVNFSVLPEHIPAHILTAAGDLVKARQVFCMELLEGLNETVPAVRFSFPAFALSGAEGLASLTQLLCKARELGYYVFLDGVEALSTQDAGQFADIMMGDNEQFAFDGLILSSYIGSDGLKPYLPHLKNTGKDLFVVVRTANRTATELQDLLTGTRLMHMANADMVNRFVQPLEGRSGYSQLAVMAAASSADSLRSLREKYKNIFLLLDGYDYPNANAKNCSYAFDPLGHGAAACAGLSIIAAWKESGDENAYVSLAVEAAQRLKKNITRYITIL